MVEEVYMGIFGGLDGVGLPETWDPLLAIKVRCLIGFI